MIQDPITALKGVGEKKAELLNRLGIYTLSDLISYFPRSYEDRTKFLTIAELTSDTPACFRATITNTPRTSYVRNSLRYTSCTVADETAQLRITFFNQPWMADNLIRGQEYYFYGTLSDNEKRREMTNPVVEAVSSPARVTRCIIPIYSLTKGITSKALQQLIFTALELCKDELPDYMPDGLTEGMMPIYEAYREVHLPSGMDALNKARERLVFEEFFLYSLGLGLMKSRRTKQSHYPCAKGVPQSFYASLPFSLTGAQRRTLNEIQQDMASGSPMNRLVQGDVGSGKTMVALGAMLMAVNNGYQAALMAPTELLAQQHYNTISEFLEPMGISCVLLTGSMPAAKRRRILDYIAVGSAKIIVGTHALFTDTVTFNNLGLAVIDEQHRFGVRQRAALQSKGDAPHLLVLSATPIPRTLALILYGDLSVSIIDELPPGRQGVDTFLVSSGYRARLNGFIEKILNMGQQVYVVCPAVEENDETTLTAAETMFQTLTAQFPNHDIGLVHGKLRSEAKESAMASFLSGKTDILVATTVIEVGVDVKNATLMVIEDADRFGLSQLHQLRGRVGRGGEKSYCVLISDNKNQETRKRLKALCATNDGFEISRQDLELRGPGDFFGYRQSGLPTFRMASLATDLTILSRAQTAALEFLSAEPNMSDPKTEQLLRRIDTLFRNTDDTLN